MLSEKDRKTLEGIERQLSVEDPELAHQLVHGPSKKTAMRRWPYRVALGALLVLLIASSVLEMPVVAFLAVVLAGMVLGAQWLHGEWHRRKGAGAAAGS